MTIAVPCCRHPCSRSSHPRPHETGPPSERSSHFSSRRDSTMGTPCEPLACNNYMQYVPLCPQASSAPPKLSLFSDVRRIKDVQCFVTNLVRSSFSDYNQFETWCPTGVTLPRSGFRRLPVQLPRTTSSDYRVASVASQIRTYVPQLVRVQTWVFRSPSQQRRIGIHLGTGLARPLPHPLGRRVPPPFAAIPMPVSFGGVPKTQRCHWSLANFGCAEAMGITSSDPWKCLNRRRQVKHCNRRISRP